MTHFPGLEPLPPARRADIIMAHARADLSRQLWQAALGDAGGGDAGAGGAGGPHARHGGPCCGGAGGRMDGRMDGLWGLAGEPAMAALPFRAARNGPAAPPLPVPPAPTELGTSGASGAAALDLGANAAFAPLLARAAERTGIAPAALAAVIDAEAAKGRGGRWNLHSRNPRSSAAGLGQFLSGTWQGLAETRGSWLNGAAKRAGWLDGRGQILPAHRAALLRLRYDATAAVESIADYARANLSHLRRRGVAVEGGADTAGRAIYLAHHLGPADAVRFLKGGLDKARARTLLVAQVGSAEAGRRIADTGDASAAHRQWLSGYVARRIRPDRYVGHG